MPCEELNRKTGKSLKRIGKQTVSKGCCVGLEENRKSVRAWAGAHIYSMVLADIIGGMWTETEALGFQNDIAANLLLNKPKSKDLIFNKIVNYYEEALKKYNKFSGRANRTEYWYFVLFNALISIGFSVLDSILGIDKLLESIYSLAVLIPSVAVGVRRMHDVNKSGWFIVIPIYNLVLSLPKGTEGDNKYG